MILLIGLMLTNHIPRIQRRKDLDMKEIERLAKEGGNSEAIPVDPPIQNPIDMFGKLSMFFIQDFGIESKKTFKNRAWWKVVVWKAQQSVEMIPNDVVIKVLQADVNCSWAWVVKYCTANANQFDFSVNSWSPYTTESSWIQPLLTPNIIQIVMPWIYEIEFAYGITSISDLWAIKFAIEQNWVEVLKDKHERPQVLDSIAPSYTTPITTLSWYRRWKVELAKWDLIEFVTTTSYSWWGSFTVDQEYTYRSIHYFSSNR